MTDAFQNNCATNGAIDSMINQLTPDDTQVQIYRQQFEAEFLELQDQQSSTGRLLYVFLRRTLRNFHLQDTYSESYVLNEAYMRGITYLTKGTPIFHPAAWLRKTAYNIIRELHRDHIRCVKLDETMAETLPTSHAPEELANNLVILQLAFQMLDAKDQRLLNLKIVEGLSWQEINQILRQCGESDCSEAGLRKRKERALIRLRNTFHTLQPNHPGLDLL